MGGMKDKLVAALSSGAIGVIALAVFTFAG